MAYSDNDIFDFLADMPPDMKQVAVEQMEILRGMTVADFLKQRTDYEAKRIKEAETFLTDVETNPDNYTHDMIGVKMDEILNGIPVTKKLDRRIGLARWFVSERNAEFGKGDGTKHKPHANLTYEEFIKTKKPL
jgi:hypothetical protein